MLELFKDIEAENQNVIAFILRYNKKVGVYWYTNYFSRCYKEYE